MISEEVRKNWDYKLDLPDSGSLYDLIKLIPIEFIKNCIVNHALQVSTKDNYSGCENTNFMENKISISFTFYRVPRTHNGAIMIHFYGDSIIEAVAYDYSDNSFSTCTNLKADMNDEKSMKNFYEFLNSYGVDILSNTIEN